MKNTSPNYLIPVGIASNLFPLFGVIYYNWTIFSIVYIYWVELIIISTFQLFKILLASGDNEIPFSSRLSMAFKFFAFRTGIFFFYLTFIVTFLGFLISSNDKEGRMDVITTLAFQNEFFKVAVLSFIVYNLLEFVVLFIINRKYQTSGPKEYYQIFDARIIVVHIVVILVTFLYQFLLEKNDTSHKTAMVACVSLFILVKSVADYFRQKFIEIDQKNEERKFI
jgi:hypothetical protein